MKQIPPQDGERILVFKEGIIQTILGKQKSLEIRGRKMKAGSFWLGCKGQINGKALFGDPVPIPDLETWTLFRPKHLVESDVLPYKKTYGMPLLDVTALGTPIPFKHTPGAVAIVIFRRSEG